MLKLLIYVNKRHIKESKLTDKIATRMGDGERIYLDPKVLKEDLLLGSEDAANIGNIPKLSKDELDHLYEIFAEQGRTVSVPHGSELIMTDDGIGENLSAKSLAIGILHFVGDSE